MRSPMTNTTNSLFVSIALFCSAFMLETAHAEQALLPVNASDQFITQLPDVDREVLVERLEKLRAQLIQRKQTLVHIVADKKLDGSDAIITVLMPGGLLYAGYKQVRYEQAMNELAHVNADIREYSGDLLAMQSRSGSLIVAQLP